MKCINILFAILLLSFAVCSRSQDQSDGPLTDSTTTTSSETTTQSSAETATDSTTTTSTPPTTTQSTAETTTDSTTTTSSETTTQSTAETATDSTTTTSTPPTTTQSTAETTTDSTTTSSSETTTSSIATPTTTPTDESTTDTTTTSTTTTTEAPSVGPFLLCYQCSGSECDDLSDDKLVQCGEGATTTAKEPTETTSEPETTTDVPTETESTTEKSNESLTVLTSKTSALIGNYRSISRHRRDTSEKYYACYSINTKENGNTVNHRGCIAVPNGEVACEALQKSEDIKEKEPSDCMTCQRDKCNSSGAMKLSLIAFLMVFIMKTFH